MAKQQRGEHKLDVQHKRSKLRTEDFSKEYQAVVSEPSLQVLVMNGLATEEGESSIDAAMFNGEKFGTYRGDSPESASLLNR